MNTKTTFFVASDLVAAVVLRGCGHGITGTRDGHYLTKQVIVSTALNAFRNYLMKQRH